MARVKKISEVDAKTRINKNIKTGSFKMNLQFFAGDVKREPGIFGLVRSSELVSYWNTRNEQESENLLGEELFDEQQKLGLTLEWIIGASGLAVVLKPSAYDVVAFKRDRIGFGEMITKMPFFKESMDIDEELRQNLNMVIETGNQVYIDTILNRIFNDEIQLLRGARMQRERMKMMLLTTGLISIAANGQSYDYDYGMKSSQKKTPSVAWSNSSADIITDITTWQDEIEEATGVRPTRMVMTRKTFSYIKKNNLIKNAIWGNNSTAPVSTGKIKEYIMAETGCSIAIYNKKFVDEHGDTKSLIPDDLVSLIPEGKLGTGWFGTTPEQSDLMSNAPCDVTITDTGVAVTTSKKVDPVNVETKVSMIFLPSAETIDQWIIAQVAS